MTIREYLNTPIPRKVALGAVVGQGVFSFLLGRWAVHHTIDLAENVISDQFERIKIYDETVNFLLERADDRALVELNEKLDFWRVIRGIDPPE